jgi:acetyl esterase/lipase
MPLRRLILAATLLTVASLFAAALPVGADGASAEPAPIRLWPNGAPGSDVKHWPSPDYHEEWETPGEILQGVTDPTIQVYLPEPAINTGAAVVICPGGGYRNLWINKEGWKVARELQKRGIAGIVLKYRYYDRLAAVQDAHRAVRTVRARADEWRINPQAVGIGGFSAGGHLALNMAAQLGRAEDWTPDQVDRQAKRPDFVMAIYPSVRMTDSAVLDSSFPPVFLAVAADDDKMTPATILPFIGQLHDLRVPVELHLYQSGGHGFGIGTPACGCSSWLDLFRNWLELRGLLGKESARQNAH